MRLVLLTPLALTLAGCLFTDDPACFPGEERDRCALGEICVDRVCVPDPAAPDARLDPDDGIAPDRGPPDLDATPPTDGAPPDRGPPPPDMTPPDMTSPMPCTPAVESCNAIDDDCDHRIDEALDGCRTYALNDDEVIACGWIERGQTVYLFCPEPVSQSDARRRCRGLGMQLAFTDTCEEGEWIGLTGEAIAYALGYLDAGDPINSTNGWWIDLALDTPGDTDSLFRYGDGAVGDHRCWNTDEPNNVLGDERCVDLLPNEDIDGEHIYGWNDDMCGRNFENWIGTACEHPCDPSTDADRDGFDACVDCDDNDRDAPGDDAVENCPDGIPFYEPTEGTPRPFALPTPN